MIRRHVLFALPAVSFASARAFAQPVNPLPGMTTVVSGGTLPDAGPTDNATAWIGAIPRDGNYLILAAMRPGPAAPPSPYNLTVSLQ